MDTSFFWVRATVSQDITCACQIQARMAQNGHSTDLAFSASGAHVMVFATLSAVESVLQEAEQIRASTTEAIAKSVSGRK